MSTYRYKSGNIRLVNETGQDTCQNCRVTKTIPDLYPDNDMNKYDMGVVNKFAYNIAYIGCRTLKFVCLECFNSIIRDNTLRDKDWSLDCWPDEYAALYPHCKCGHSYTAHQRSNLQALCAASIHYALKRCACNLYEPKEVVNGTAA